MHQHKQMSGAVLECNATTSGRALAHDIRMLGMSPPPFSQHTGVSKFQVTALQRLNLSSASATYMTSPMHLPVQCGIVRGLLGLADGLSHPCILMFVAPSDRLQPAYLKENLPLRP